MDARVTRLETSVEYIKNDVADIKTDVREMRGEISTLTEQGNTMRGELTTLTGQVGTLTGQVGTLIGKVDILIEQGNTTVGRVGALEINVATLNEPVRHLPSKGYFVAVVMAGLALLAALCLFQGNVQAFFKIKAPVTIERSSAPSH